jgi:hypothetical protein
MLFWRENEKLYNVHRAMSLGGRMT